MIRPLLEVLAKGAHRRDGIMLVGYRPYSAIRQAMARAFPEVPPPHERIVARQYAAFWGELLPREMEEIGSARVAGREV